MSAHSTLVLSKSPLLYWRFNETSGLSVTDSSGNGVAGNYRDNGSGALSGETLNQPSGAVGDTDPAVLFDGVNGVATTAAAFATNLGAHTFVGYFKVVALPASGNNATLMGKGGTTDINESVRLILQNNSGTYRLIYGGADNLNNGINHGVNVALPANKIVVGAWNQLAGTWDGTAYNVYVNGFLLATMTDPVGPVPTDGRFAVAGQIQNQAGTVNVIRNANVVADEVAVFGRALPPAELQQLNTAYFTNLLAPTLVPIFPLGPTVQLQVPAPQFGIAPYANQLQRSATTGTGFANVGSATVDGTLTDPSPTVGTLSYYRVVTTDATGLAVTSAEFAFTPWNAAQAQFVGTGTRNLFVHWNEETFLERDGRSNVSSPAITNIFGNVNGANSANGTIGTYSPMTLNIDDWVAKAQSMAADCAVFTAKHGDGVCMWPSVTSPFNVTATTWGQANPGQADILKTFQSKFKAAGLKVGVYYTVAANSQADRFQQANSATYNAGSYNLALLNEIMDRGPWDAVYLDNSSDASNLGVTYASMESLILGRYPNCAVIGNNNLGPSNYSAANGPITMPSSINTRVVEWEKAGLPNNSTTGPFNGSGGDFPLAVQLNPTNETTTCWTTYDASGGPQYFDHATAATLGTPAFFAALINRSNGLGASFMLNAPPTRTGSYAAPMAALLAALAPRYTVSAASATVGQAATITFTRVGGTWATGDTVGVSDGVGGSFGAFTFTPGQATATVSYRPATSGAKFLRFNVSASVGGVNAKPALVTVSAASGGGGGAATVTTSTGAERTPASTAKTSLAAERGPTY